MTQTVERIGTGTTLRAQDLHRTYGSGGAAVRALRGVSVEAAPGTLTVVTGPSGSGKTALLHCLAGLDRPTRGSVRWDGTELTRLSDRGLAELRRTRAGFVSPAFNLVPTLTAAENVARAGGRPEPGRVREVLALVGLAGCERQRPGRLCGERQQRLAVACALVSRPDVLFADEPAGALGPAAGRALAALLRTAVDTEGRACVLATADPAAAAYADRVLVLAGGLVVDDRLRPAAAHPGRAA
ncbi:ABC transporter ATP-binding protein [Streptomyces sp. NBC_00525]|uniref:ABC transporter ATP-binding protein n=1 Tax=Streptomyces sp. NBC_00525 TaxID=2903660 RepID=UPI002E80B8EB|nr:ATP-binding cassette domain-containing protein [Streptomyces sp. NBC_00525]WUC92507.1 ATP-binding cassette domain-containing protein [Streptomyces sp. NBC_00525]